MLFALCVLSAIMLIAQISAVKECFFWNVDFIYSGEVWRILTGNLTHFNMAHLAMNMAGLWLIVWIFHPTIFTFKAICSFKTSCSSKASSSKPKANAISEFVLPISVISLVVGIALFFTDIHSYVGLSGTLHGLFGFYAIREYFTKQDNQGKFFSVLFILGLLAKVSSEQFFGSLTSSQDLIGSEIATQAHFAGAISGLILGGLSILFTRKNEAVSKD